MDRRRPRPTPPVDHVAEQVHVPEHTHPAPRSNQRVLLAAAACCVLVLGYLGYLQYSTNARQMETNARLMELEAYVAEARIKRDAQNEDVNQRISEASCDFLDRLPAGPLWDPMREKYKCGPGIPANLYPEAWGAGDTQSFYQTFPITSVEE